ncbi:hypothetical protein AJ78_02927 [Emergomyces pasteurianus Ep9510]|uniref:GED domain-containing protein n=1 Tax=Emergomyces pasteurianus Ep9510 TaxID=1447872 RepID=A0A1J9PKH1_9EURO|nr:hypothetical protein AJ78_02927 [Emergomyces pasteurianus Ep9510]
MTVDDAGYSRLGDPGLLDRIDQLFACNVGDYIDLPQLVVVGDQSSGKSSVLEGLTKLPFPRQSGLCTRFATQITFRRAKTKMIAVSIIPQARASAEHANRMKGWSTGVQKLDAKTFEKIMEEVHEVMGLSDNQTECPDLRRTFSNDVLRLEIVGPDEDHMSVIDVPGIFKTTTPGKTTKHDIDMVREMVLGYMQNPRSVMLTVVPANVDIATQEIVEMAKELDPGCDRTLGVLTKPDLVDKGAENDIVDMIGGKRPGSQIQWSVVRNPGQQELQRQNTDRHSEASFFRDVGPWNTLDKDRVGIVALRARLQEVLTCHTRREFPKVKSEIGKRLKASREALRSLGVERDTPEKQSRFLLDIVKRFQDLVTLALTTNYGADDLFDEHPNLRIATEVVRRNSIFSNQMEKLGQEYWFNPKDEACKERIPGTNVTQPSPPEVPSLFGEETTKIRGANEQLEVRVTSDPAELEDILHGQEVLSAPSSNIQEWLETTYTNSCGFELGTDTVVIVHTFIITAIPSLCADERVRTNLLSNMMDRLIERYRMALEQVLFLLQVERVGTPMTQNHYFNDNLQKCRQKRIYTALESMGVAVAGMPGKIVRLENILHRNPMSNTRHTVQDIHDILESYYKVARKRFVDNVCMQAADHHLITGPNTPLKLLSPAYILDLTAHQLEDIAGEDPGLTRKRKQLKKEIGELEKGRKVLL